MAADLATDSVGASELLDNSIDTGEVINDSLFANDLGASSVGSSELANNAVDGAKVANDGLTFSDIAGGATTGSLSIAANSVASGRCEGVTVGISGATAGDSVVISVRDAMQDGVFLYGTEVTSASTARVMLCNLSGAVQAAITDLPIRLVTFH